MNSSKKDNRSAPRYRVRDVGHVRISLQTESGRWPGTLDNISTTGMAVRLTDAAADIKKSEEVFGEMSAGTLSEVFMASVIWTQQTQQGSLITGLRFLTETQSTIEWVTATTLAAQDINSSSEKSYE